MQEFCHVVAYIAARKEVTDKVRRSLWRPEVMKKQLEELGREEVKPLLRPWVRHHHSGNGVRSGGGRA